MIVELERIRDRIISREKSLSPWASQETLEANRKRPEPPCPLRGEFQRDRDRIVHAKAFRRLKHKSQVLVAPQGDHFTTRLTHVMEVAQIGRTIARALNLNEDLVEAAALGHDLGHTPFGHIGETVINRRIPEGFHHSRHSIRIVEKLEKDGRGLNLTSAVIEAIRRHSKPEGKFITRQAVKDMSLEAQIVRLSDSLAYLAHDMNDAMRAGALTLLDFPSDLIEGLGRTHSKRVNTLVTDVIMNSWDCTGSVELSNPGGTPWIRMSKDKTDLVTSLRDFMFERFYHKTSNSIEGLKASEIVEVLLDRFLERPQEIPENVKRTAEDVRHAAIDYVCGMTDNFALAMAERVAPGISEGVFRGAI